MSLNVAKKGDLKGGGPQLLIRYPKQRASTTRAYRNVRHLIGGLIYEDTDAPNARALHRSIAFHERCGV
jgi:hypothetical protein